MRNSAVFLVVLSLVGGAYTLAQTTGGPDTQPSPSPTVSPTTTASPGISPTPTTTPSPVTTDSATTREVALNKTIAINLLHHINRLEIRQSQEALSRLQNQQARDYAQTLITEHQATEQRALQVANTENIDIYSFQPATFEIAAENELRALTGSEFDRGFILIQQQGHQRALQDLQLARGTVTDTEVLALLDQAITSVQTHLNTATSILGQLPTT